MSIRLRLSRLLSHRTMILNILNCAWAKCYYLYLLFMHNIIYNPKLYWQIRANHLSKILSIKDRAKDFLFIE